MQKNKNEILNTAIKVTISILIFSLLCLTAYQAAAQEKKEAGILKGTVVDSDKNPVAFTTVSVVNLKITTTTNEAGEYTLRNLPAGTQIIQVTYVSTDPVRKEVLIEKGKTSILDFSLAQSSRALGEVVVTGQKRRVSAATKTSTKIEDIPMSIQIVNKELMQQQQIIDVRDIIKNVSGMVTSGTYNGGYSYFSSRGFFMNTYNNQRRNGMMIWNMGQLFNDNIEQTEILKGPASVLYGDLSPGGIINFVTKKPLNYDFKRIEMRVGEYGLFRPAIDMSGPLDKKGNLLYRLNASYEKSKSFRDVVKNETIMVSTAFTWKIHPKLTWDVEAIYKSDERVGDPGIASPDGSFEAVKKLPVSVFHGEPAGIYNYKEKNLFSTINYQINANWNLRNQTFLSRTDRQPYNIYFSGTPDANGNLTRNQYTYHQYWNGFANTLDLIGNFRTGPLKHQAIAGLELMKNGGKWTKGIYRELDSAINVYRPRYGLSIMHDDPQDWEIFYDYLQQTGVYVQDQISAFDDKLQLLIGARYNFSSMGQEYNSKQDEPQGHNVPVNKLISPRAGLVYKPVKNISVYGSYSQSYEMNGSDYYNRAIAIQPTDASQIEFGVKTSILQDRLGITLSAFQIDKKDIYGFIESATEPAFEYISWDSLRGYASFQGGHHRSKGIEIDMNGKITKGLSANASYAYVDAYIIDDLAYKSGNQLWGSPKNSGSIWLNYAFQKKLKGLELGYGYFYKGSFYGSNDNDPGELVEGFYTMDVSVGYTFKILTARFNLSNFTNNKGYLGYFGAYEPQWVRRAVFSVAIKL